jgi:hypothetical protein
MQLRTGADGARSDDTSRLKNAVVVWVDKMYGPSNPPLRANSKDERGLENDNTGRLLCPSEYSWDDPACVAFSLAYVNLLISLGRVRAKIREGHADFLVTADSWPMFLYEDYTCDTNDFEHGLFRSKLLLKVIFSLFYFV